MKGLAFKAPYGSALFHGKDLENRSRVTWDHEGWLCVYQSAGFDRTYYEQGVLVCRSNGWEPPDCKAIPRGVILGVVWCDRKVWGTESKGWGFANHWQFAISRQHLFSKPIHFRAKFMLGLFDVPDDLIAEELEGTGILSEKQLKLI